MLLFVFYKLNVPKIASLNPEFSYYIALRPFHVSKPRVITVDKNPAYSIAIE
ncbi:hypothetical protein IC7_05782 [Bacillus cereus BAG1O-1]|nr:hypothetical protein IC7_05782 [Bacillus cereus BAG1O-1]